jgi:hypothetical protein
MGMARDCGWRTSGPAVLAPTWVAPSTHTAGAVCIGARLARRLQRDPYESTSSPLGARALDPRVVGRAARCRRSRSSCRGASSFDEPVRVDETRPADVVAELERRGVAMGATQVIGLRPRDRR